MGRLKPLDALMGLAPDDLSIPIHLHHFSHKLPANVAMKRHANVSKGKGGCTLFKKCRSRKAPHSFLNYS